MQFQNDQVVIKEIHDAWRSGRGIVPVLGSGFSVEAGIPPLEGLFNYLARFRGFLQERVFLPRAPDIEEEGSRVLKTINEKLQRYAKDPSLFVKEFGWPNFHTLYRDYGRWLNEKTPKRIMAEEVKRHLDELTRLLYPDQVAQLERQKNRGVTTLLETYRPQETVSELWRSLGRWPDLVHHFSGGDAHYARSLFEQFRHGRFPGMSHRFLALLTPLLNLRLFLSTNYDKLFEKALEEEDVDYTSFVMEGGRRFPPAALLHKNTSIIKMDEDLTNLLDGGAMYLPLEKNWLQEFKDALPKDPLLLVMGSSGRDRRVLDFVRAVIATRNEHTKGPSMIWLHYERLAPRSVLQLPELQMLSPTKDQNQRSNPKYLFARVTQPGLFLSHLYYALTSRHPSGRRPYVAHPQRPVNLTPRETIAEVPTDQEKDDQEAGVHLYHNPSRNCYFFTDYSKNMADEVSLAERLESKPNASERMAAFINNLHSFTPVWIDLEGQYTLAGVVGGVIDQCRNYDPDLAPAVLPLSAEKEEDRIRILNKSSHRILEALSRGRYALAFDCLEGYTWRQTVHHGDLDNSLEGERTLLVDFLKNLIEGVKTLPDSILCISMGSPIPRRMEQQSKPLKQSKTLQDILDELKKAISPKEQPKHWIFPHHLPDSPIWTPPCDDGNLTEQVMAGPKDKKQPSGFEWRTEDSERLALFCLSCFRRTRNLVALRLLLKPLIKNKQDQFYQSLPQIDQLLNRFEQTGVLLPVAGGGYWMNRLLRDRMYSSNSQFTKTEVIRGYVVSLLKDGSDTKAEGTPDQEKQSSKEKSFNEGDLKRTVLQCLLLTYHHDSIARYYYFNNYVQSHDAVAFFEYVYHRVSSIRYLTKLVLLQHLIEDTHESSWKNIKEACSEYFSQSALSKGYLDLVDELSEQKKGEPSRRFHFPQHFQDRRRREIAALRLSWQRSRLTLLRTVPAEQLVSWCKWLIEDDLPRFRVKTYSKKVTKAESKVTDSDLENNIPKQIEKLDSEVENEIRQLEFELYDLWAQSCRERSDYDGCIALRLKQQIELSKKHKWGDYTSWKKETSELVEFFVKELTKPGPDLLKKFIPAIEIEGLDTELEQACTCWLDIADCLASKDKVTVNNSKKDENKPGHRSKDDSNNIPTTLLINLIESLERTKEEPRIYFPANKTTRELIFRCKMVLAEAQLGQVNYWRDEYPFIDSKVRKTGREVFEVTRKALADVRQEEMNDRDSYFEYRVHFLMARARALYSPSMENGDVSDEPLSPPFGDAYHDLELSRGGPHFDDDLLHVRADFFGAELALIEADELLARHAGLRETQQVYPLLIGNTPLQLLDRAAAKHAIAGRYLKRLPERLAHGRRNTIWWKFYFQLYAQYLSEVNLWHVANVIERIFVGSQPNIQMSEFDLKPHEVSQFVNNNWLGLQAIRRGFDRAIHTPSLDEWLLQVWRELFLSTFLFGRLAELISEWSQKKYNMGTPEINELLQSLVSNQLTGSADTQWLYIWWYHNQSATLLTDGKWKDKDSGIDLLKGILQKKLDSGQTVIERMFQCINLESKCGLNLRHEIGQIAQNKAIVNYMKEGPFKLINYE